MALAAGFYIGGNGGNGVYVKNNVMLHPVDLYM
jgi:hypothetical protein